MEFATSAAIAGKEGDEIRAHDFVKKKDAFVFRAIVIHRKILLSFPSPSPVACPTIALAFLDGLG